MHLESLLLRQPLGLIIQKDPLGRKGGFGFYVLIPGSGGLKKITSTYTNYIYLALAHTLHAAAYANNAPPLIMHHKKKQKRSFFFSILHLISK